MCIRDSMGTRQMKFDNLKERLGKLGIECVLISSKHSINLGELVTKLRRQVDPNFNPTSQKSDASGKLKEKSVESVHQKEQKTHDCLTRTCLLKCSKYGPRSFYICIRVVLWVQICLLYTSPSPRDGLLSRMPSSA
eukprot:TRINITY_DN6591_c0_g1_i1.p1 TRINITY_DN6591_c0_g1~~TRINITY_DN6591_c0_g1_i1.p1  ORF type:complete len:136 (-),score=3.71 TRINITY_DN6591_c0_g1_i1:11-418(-)